MPSGRRHVLIRTPVVGGAPGVPTSLSVEEVWGQATFENGKALVTATADGAQTYRATANPGSIVGFGATPLVLLQGLGGGETYTVTMAAWTGTNWTSESASVSYFARTSPDVPTIGTATALDASATVAFTAPSDDGGATITSFVARAHAVQGDGSTVTTGFTGSGSSSPVTVPGLANGQAYKFSVTALNVIGASFATGLSNSVTPVEGTETDPGTNPSTVANRQAWYEADSLSLTDGASVTSVSDASGNSRTLTPDGTVTWFSSVFNGQPAFRMGSGRLRSAVFGSALAQPLTFYFVVKYETLTGGDTKIFDGEGSARVVVMNVGVNLGLYAGTLPVPSGIAADLNRHVYCAVLDGANSRLYRNGTLVLGPQNVGSQDYGRVVLGGDETGVQLFDGYKAAWGVFSAAHDNATINGIGNWLATKYGGVWADT